MGNTESKQGSAPHVWRGSGPTSISQNMVEQLQSSMETDASRSQTLELQIQARVASELRKLQASESAKLKEAQAAMSSDDSSSSPITATDTAMHTSSNYTADTQQQQQINKLSQHTVSKDVENLRRRLDSRKQVREMPESAERARSEVVRCLRDNDRRPLDCWQEVKTFKEEVRKLEMGWVDRIVSS